MLAADAVAHGLKDENGKQLVGAAHFKQFVQTFRAAFPNIRITVEDVVAEGDKVAARCLVSGTHSGDSLGIAPTQKEIQIEGIALVRIADGKIVEGWNSFDFMSLYQQIDAI